MDNLQFIIHNLTNSLPFYFLRKGQQWHPFLRVASCVGKKDTADGLTLHFGDSAEYSHYVY